MLLQYNCKDHTDCVYDAKFLSDDRFVSCSRDQTIRLFDIKNGAPITSFTSSSRPFSICSLQGGSLVVTAHFDGKLRGWDFRTRGAPLEFKAHKGTVGFVTSIPGMTQLLSYGSDDKFLMVSDLRAKNLIGKVPHKPAVPREKIQLALWGDQAVIGAANGHICAYDLTTFRLKEMIKGAESPVYCVAAKPNFGLATGDQSGVVRFWFN
jgi:WD40 repeat protein